MGISSGNAEDVTRSAAEPITETVSLGDGMLMEMSLAPDPAAELRDAATTPLANGVKFLLIAVNAADNKYVSHAEYTMTGGVPVINGDSVHVRAGGNYKFMCVSFNNATSLLTPDDYSNGTLVSAQAPTFQNLPNNVDLLYWSQTVNNVTERQVLPVSFRHQFDFVKVKVDCSYNGWNITNLATDGIQLNTYSTFELTPTTGVSGVTATTKAVRWPSSFTAGQIQESIGDTVYLSKLDIQLAKDALTLPTGSTPAAAYTFAFSSASFAAGGGKSYVLTVKIKQPMFASTNVYWDDTKLTFKGYSDSPSATYGDTVKYQGVFFKFGSLVGISPEDEWEESSTVLYVPRSGSDSYTTYAYPASGHPEWTGADYASIPYVSDGTETNNRNNRYVIDMIADSFAVMKGDICRYLEFTNAAPPRPRAELRWSLPTSAEFGLQNTTWGSNGWTKVGAFGPRTSTSAAGTYSGIPSGGNFGATANFFPASGYRHATGSLDGTGTTGYYWTGSVNGSRGYTLYCTSSHADAHDFNERANSFAVRCVLRE
jgi:hypothetical protein